MADINLFDDDNLPVDDEELEEEFDDEGEEEYVRPKRERRPASRKKKKKKKSALVPIIIIIAVMLALGAAYYFFLGDMLTQFIVDKKIEGLADVASFEDVTAYSAAVSELRAKVDGLDADVRAKVNESALTAAENSAAAMLAARDTLAALPAADITVAQYPDARTLITDSRAAFDQLTDAEKLLVGESTLTNAEMLLNNCYTANGPVIDLNDEITAFVVSQDTARATIDSETAACVGLINRAAGMDQTLVDAAALAEKKAQIGSKIDQFSDAAVNETSEISGYSYTISGLVKNITDAVAATEKKGGKYPYDTDTLSATADQISATITSIQGFTAGTAVGVAALEHDYGADMNMQLTLMSGHIADAIKYMKDNEIDDDDELAALNGHLDSANAALKAYSDASQTYFSEITAVVQSYQPFLNGGVNAAIEFTPFVGAAAAVGGTDTAVTDPAATDDPDAAGTDTPAAAEEEGEAGYVNAEDVNFRDAPNTDGNSLGKQALNTKLRILGEDDGWYKVKIGDKTGYIRSDFVSKGDPS